jgi:endo-1,4-beta-D-glucanase Y
MDDRGSPVAWLRALVYRLAFGVLLVGGVACGEDPKGGPADAAGSDDAASAPDAANANEGGRVVDGASVPDAANAIDARPAADAPSALDVGVDAAKVVDAPTAGDVATTADASISADVGSMADGADAAVLVPATPMRPFGSHAFAYPAGALKPSQGQAVLDAAVRAYYDKWSARYLAARCGGYVVVTEGATGASDGTFTVSEAHGYGMLITALMAGHDPDAQAKFNGLYRVFRAFPSTNDPDLMDWQILDRCPIGETCTQPVPGCFRIAGPPSGSATDGDLDIAFALLLADKQWGSAGAIAYLAEAKKVIAAIKAKEMNPITKLPRLADDVEAGSAFYFTIRSSDLMTDHFRAFATATGDSFWTQAADASYGLVADLQARYAATTGLLPDFIVKTDGTAQPAPPRWPGDAGPATGEYSYNACRFPWRLATDFVVSGDTRAKSALAKLNVWIKDKSGGNARNIVDGYRLDGQLSSQVSGPDLAFTAPFALAAMTGADQAWVDALWKNVSDAPLGLYYGDTIKMLGGLVASGNWWGL